ncbi:MAG: RluA family pseudouridine synthase [Waddliaceae bacterium]
MLKFQVNSNQPMRLVHFLHDQLKGVSSLRALKNDLEKNRCQVNGVTERYASFRVKKGDNVTFLQKETEEKKPLVLFEDDHLYIIDKKAWTTCDDKFMPPYRLVHRLDHQTTGVVILAKNHEIYQEMVRIFRERRVKKKYLALIDGVPKGKKGTIEENVRVTSRKGNQVMCGISRFGKPSVTHWVLEKKCATHTLISCLIETGRTHQIRVHMKSIGNPILGDYQYSRTFNFKANVPRVMLHAHMISFTHPVTKEWLEVTAPIPKDFKELIPR